MLPSSSACGGKSLIKFASTCWYFSSWGNILVIRKILSEHKQEMVSFNKCVIIDEKDAIIWLRNSQCGNQWLVFYRCQELKIFGERPNATHAYTNYLPWGIFYCCRLKGKDIDIDIKIFFHMTINPHTLNDGGKTQFY